MKVVKDCFLIQLVDAQFCPGYCVYFLFVYLVFVVSSRVVFIFVLVFVYVKYHFLNFVIFLSHKYFVLYFNLLNVIRLIIV